MHGLLYPYNWPKIKCRDISGLWRLQRKAWGHNTWYCLFYSILLLGFTDTGQYNYLVSYGVDIGESVTVEDEVVVTNSIVLPNKTLNVSVQDEIIL